MIDARTTSAAPAPGAGIPGQRRASRIERLLEKVSVGLIVVIAAVTTPFTPSFAGAFWWLGNVLLKSLNAVSVIALVFICGFQVWQFYTTIKVVGIRAFRGIPRIRLLAARSRTHGNDSLITMYLAFFLVLGGAGCAFLISPAAAIFPVCLAMTMLMLGVVNRWRPPLILFLSTSNEDTLLLVGQLRFENGATRIVSMLDDEVAPSPDVGQYSRYDNFRTSGGHQWQDVIHELMDLVALIIIDARWSTSGVVIEIQRVIASSYLNKTVFILTGQGEGPALPDEYSANPSLADKMYCLRRHECSGFVRRFVSHPDLAALFANGGLVPLASQRA